MNGPRAPQTSTLLISTFLGGREVEKASNAPSHSNVDELKAATMSARDVISEEQVKLACSRFKCTAADSGHFEN